jgi:nitrosocyanin
MMLVLLVAGILLFGCAGQQTQPPPSPGDAMGPKDGAMMGKEVVVEMTAKQWEFNPNTVTVKKGDRVKLVITSQDVTHGFSLPDFGVSSVLLEPGQATNVEFTADKTGDFTFRCSNFCGTGHSGMTGKLVVTE